MQINHNLKHVMIEFDLKKKYTLMSLSISL